MIGKLWCWMVRKHVWRKAHKTEPGGNRYCRRCGTGRTVKKRQAKA